MSNSSGETSNYSFTVRVDRPIQGCELIPNPFLQLRSVFSAENISTRPRMVDPNSFSYSFVWKRGPHKPACANPTCMRGNSFEPLQWSKAVLGGPGLVCNVCHKTGGAAHESSFCSRGCFISAWKEHSKRHVNYKGRGEDPEDNNENEESTTNLTDTGSMLEWKVIGESKSYTPTIDDVGCRLRIEVTAISHTEGVLAGPIAICTEPVLASPVRPPKRGLQMIQGANTGIAGALRFRVVSYNILAEQYATKQAYPYCDAWNLYWPFRRKILLDELEEMQGDVVCLQEVQADHYEADIQPFMQSLGYDGIYKAKSREFVGQYGKVDGCATFWKKSKFLMSENYSFEFNDLARQEASTSGFDEGEARRFMNRLNRDNIAQILVLESLTRANTTRGGAIGRSLLCVVNTHLYSNSQRPDVKLWQTMNLIREISGIVPSRDLPLLICGDFNSEPSSAVYEFLTHGAVSTESHPELLTALQDKVRVLPELHTILHELQLSSAMETSFSNEPSFTNYTAKFKGTLDYIFYTPNRLRILAATSFPEENDIKSVGGEGLPCACYPSDHILLCCDVALTPGGILGGDTLMSSTSAKLSSKSVRGGK